MTINHQKQRGMALLATTILLLTVMLLLALMSMKSVTSQQRIIGNDLRRRQALDAADAGLAYGIAKAIYNTPSVETQISAVEISALNTQLNPVSDSYKVGNVLSIKICPPSGNRYHVIAAGESNDGKASRTVERWVGVGTSSSDSGYVLGTWKDFDVSNSC